MTDRPRFRYRRATRGRLAAWAVPFIAALAGIILLVQLFAAAAHHDHELAAKSQHCVACALHAHPDTAPPGTPPEAASPAWSLLGMLPPPARTASAAPAADHLLPPSQAPPPFLSSR